MKRIPVLIALLFAGVMLFPLYILLKIALSDPSDIFAQPPPYLIRHFTWRHFHNVFTSGASFFSPLVKSCLTGVLATSASILIASPAAYAASRLPFRVRSVFILVIFVTRMIPEISIALPVSISFIRLGLFDTTLGLTLAHLIRILPVTCFILTGVFAAIPRELENQARIDGADRLTVFRRVIVPLSAGGMTVAAVFSFLLSWDEFIYASYLTLAHPTMPLKMYYYVSRGDIFSSATYAVIITIPVLIMTFALQKYLKPDYLAGALKG
ncbi:MAG: carbohydrate ABC transporter permease [Candidatus Omnitrophica bacterium]|nr:carbohydrate ABC transporter permease [Candidatus Omnitrophota bacterium]